MEKRYIFLCNNNKNSKANCRKIGLSDAEGINVGNLLMKSDKV
jgi:hypothetical protein